MRRPKVIDRTSQAPPFVPRQGLAGQRPATARQWRAAFPARRVPSLPVRGIEHAVPWRAASARLHACRRAIEHAAVGRAHPSPLVTLDNVGDQDLAPGPPPGPPPHARVPGVATSLSNGAEVSHQASGPAQQGTTGATAPHPLAQPPEQGPSTRLAALTAQPQACRAQPRQRHPHAATRLLDRTGICILRLA